MDTLLQDIQYGVRMVAKSPGFAAIAILTLALGIGANTALFSVVNGVLLNPLPYRQPDRLVAIYAKSKEFSHYSISYPNFLDWARGQRSFSSLAAFREDRLQPDGHGRARAREGGNGLRGFLLRARRESRSGPSASSGGGSTGRTASGADQRRILEAEIRILAGRGRENADAQRSRLHRGWRDSRRISAIKAAIFTTATFTCPSASGTIRRFAIGARAWAWTQWAGSSRA